MDRDQLAVRALFEAVVIDEPCATYREGAAKMLRRLRALAPAAVLRRQVAPRAGAWIETTARASSSP